MRLKIEVKGRRATSELQSSLTFVSQVRHVHGLAAKWDQNAMIGDSTRRLLGATWPHESIIVPDKDRIGLRTMPRLWTGVVRREQGIDTAAVCHTYEVNSSSHTWY